MRQMARLAALVALCLPLLARADVLSASWSGEVYDVSSATGAATLLHSNTTGGFNSLATDGTTYWSETGGSLYRIDPVSGVAAAGPAITGTPTTADIRALAYSGGVLYAIHQVSLFFGFDQQLWRIEPTTGIASFIGSTGLALQGLAADAAGTLYGWDVAQGLARVDPLTGLGTLVGPSPAVPDIQALGFSPAGVLYGARDELYTIDTSTGAVTLVAPISGVGGFPDVRGIEFTTAVPEPTSLALLFAGAGLLGWRVRRTK
jgi:PEP-CTERM motif-containing protein